MECRRDERRCPKRWSTDDGPQCSDPDERARGRGPSIEARFTCSDCGDALSVFQVATAELGRAFSIAASVDAGFSTDVPELDPASIYRQWKRRAGVSCPVSLEFPEPENIQVLTCRAMRAVLKARYLAAVGDAEAGARELDRLGTELVMLCAFAEWADSIAAFPHHARALDQSAYAAAIRTLPALCQTLDDDAAREFDQGDGGEALHDG
ncbi:MAG: hypothetical protein JW940_28990 [Polyangiaceae bacterium]|nr:hypothetical protein [Polyangiaceae bacterium]